MRIHFAAAGYVFHDCLEENGKLVMRMRHGLELVVAWGDDGPELVETRTRLVGADTGLHPQFAYVSGKTVAAVRTDGERLYVEFTDGHSFRIGCPHRAPEPEGVDVNVTLEGVSLYGSASAL